MTTTFDYPSSNTLLEPVAIMVIDILEQAKTLQRLMPEAFIADLPGIYIGSVPTPIIPKGTRVFHSLQTTTPSILVEISYDDAVAAICNQAILAEDGTTLVNKLPRNVADSLQTMPTVPLNITRFIGKYVSQQLMASSPWLPSHDTIDDLARLLTNNGISLLENGDIDKHLNGVIYDVIDFIEPDMFNMHNVHQYGSTLQVEKLGDWRIYQWTINKELVDLAPHRTHMNPKNIRHLALRKEQREAINSFLSQQKRAFDQFMADQEDELATLLSLEDDEYVPSAGLYNSRHRNRANYR
jgi:hypothetical protein